LKVPASYFINAASILILGWTSAAAAFTTTSHYFVATEAEQLGLDWSTRWDSEASSDFITFQRPLEWDGQFLRGDKVFDLSIGSISSRQFLSYKRVKLHQQLTEKLEFRFHWLEERDFEQDRSLLPLELKYNFTPKFAVSIMGSPSMYKRENDAGFSLYFTPDDEWEYRASALWGDFDRNKRNLQTDEWSEAPLALTISARHLPKDSSYDFINAEVHWQRPSQRTDLGVVTQDLSHESIYLTGLKSLENGRGLGARLLYDRAFASENARARTRKRSLNQFEYRFVMGPHVIRPGINLFYREARDNGDQSIYREILPTLWFQLPPKSRTWGLRTLSMGYDATIFEHQHNQSSDNNLEHRLNIKYDMRFSKAGQLALLFTFDLDRFGTEETWEGGAGQFRLDF